jgi:hypothetical protein
MSVYPNQTNATLSNAFFAAAGSGGSGTPSNWSSYPALSTITYSGAGGAANFTTINTLTSVSTPSLLVSSINNAVYPPAGGSGPIVGTLPIPADNTTLTSEIAGVTGSSVITGIYTSSDASVIVSSLIPGTNEITINLSGAAPSGSRFNYAIYPAAT